MDALEHCIRSRHIAERAIQRKGFAIDAPELIGEFKERLYLGSEAQLSVQLGPEQRLLSRAIAREQQPLARVVPDRESKHSLEPGNRVGAEALVEGHDCFDVATRAERIAPRRCRSEEHTSELQSRPHLVCRLLLEKKNYQHTAAHTCCRISEQHRPTAST